MQITQVMATGAARAQTSQLSFPIPVHGRDSVHYPPSYLAARLRRKGSHAYLTLQHHCCFSFPHHPWIKSFTGTLYKLRNCRVLKHVSLYFIVVSKTSWIDYARDTRKFGCPSFGKEQSAHQKYLPRRLAPRLQSDCTYVRH